METSTITPAVLRESEEAPSTHVLVPQPARAVDQTQAYGAYSASKFRKVEDYLRWEGTTDELEHELEVETDEYIRSECRVITGIGLRMAGGDPSANLTTLRVAFRPLDPATGLLGNLGYLTGGRAPHSELERWIEPIESPGDDQVLLCGFGARGFPGNITTLRVWTRDILPNGTLSRPVEHRYGTAKNHELEALIMVPNPGVIVGFGVRANPGGVTHLKAWFGHLVPR